MKKLELSGQKFNKLTIISDAGYSNSEGRRMWKSKCDCGKEVIAPGDKIREETVMWLLCYRKCF